MKTCGKPMTFLLLMKEGYKQTGSIVKAFVLAKIGVRYIRAIPFSNQVTVTPAGYLLYKLATEGGFFTLLSMALQKYRGSAECSTK